MKAIDFNMPKEIQFSLETGITSFRGSRIIIFDSNVMGLMKYNLIETLGIEKAREFFIRLNYQNGYEEFLNMKQNYEFDNEMELLASGPTIHTWRGIVKATPKEFSMNRETGDLLFTGVWSNSWEAEQHLMFSEPSREAVCWSLTGYASGYATAFFGKKCFALEPFCVGKGDDRCEWLIKPEKDWGEEARIYKEILKDF